MNGHPRGRPPLPAHIRLSRVVHVRLTEAEHAALEAAARRASVSVSEFVRRAALEHAAPSTGEAA